MVSLSLEWFFVGQPGAARKRCAVRLLHMDNVGVRAMANCVPDDISSLSGRAAEAAAASGATEAGHASHAGERRDANRPTARAARLCAYRLYARWRIVRARSRRAFAAYIRRATGASSRTSRFRTRRSAPFRATRCDPASFGATPAAVRMRASTPMRRPHETFPYAK
ncbi:hypothetical protein D512_00910 [Burkholderia pseudomallei MSHR1043]|nr:hypothetical protein D512_00910 [Burkholderia pseudomallei MSHR1043]